MIVSAHVRPGDVNVVRAGVPALVDASVGIRRGGPSICVAVIENDEKRPEKDLNVEERGPVINVI